MIFQDLFICFAPCDQLCFFIIMRDQCNIFLFSNGKCYIIFIHIRIEKDPWIIRDTAFVKMILDGKVKLPE